ncbi:hypothetical protein [Achromobacter xylosoxidans]|uniref:hypothetical protein n=1 Tax=Alcaligenes xylosoxydans xylosoxydans TaxID=85698 RepID=UPI0006C26BEF|nr:hypothetical protein [Achromobacter xylosoxidans]CUJ39983.1 Uncharacterised protein [Achromobacter xylosoxidans]
MADENISEDNLASPDLAAVWLLLDSQDRADYWKYARTYARQLNHSGKEYKQLCAALRDAEIGRSTNRPNGLRPGSARDLPATALDRLIGKHKEGLLSMSYAQPFIARALCHWIQDKKRGALNAVLDSVGCPRDFRGTLKGEIPEFDPEEATQTVCLLAAEHRATDLAVACGGLILSSQLWNALVPTFHALQQIPPSSFIGTKDSGVVSESRNQDNGLVSHDERVAPPITAITIQVIADGLDTLEEHLTDATKEIAARKIPDLTPAINVWKKVHGEHSHAAEQLKVTTTDLADLEAALAKRTVIERIRHVTPRCRSIEHRADPTFNGCAVIYGKCDELQSSDETGIIPLSDLEALEALVRLIEEGNKLDDATAGHLQSQVEVAFGKAIAAAAVRGNLQLGKSDSYANNGIFHDSSAISPTMPDEAEPDSNRAHERISASDDGDFPIQTLAESQQSANHDSNSATDGPTRPAEDIAAAQVAPGISQTATLEAQVESPRKDKITDPLISEQTEFETFESFCKSHWVDATGTVVSAPWLGTQYSSQLETRALDAWEEGNAAIAYLFATAAIALKVQSPFPVDDLAYADEFLSAPTVVGRGLAPARAENLRKGLVHPIAGGHVTFGISLMLEALQPTPLSTFNQKEIDSLVGTAAYKDSALNEVVRYLLLGSAAQLKPLELLRTRLLMKAEETEESLKQNLLEAQFNLRTEVATLWSAAGGKIQHTHCRAAWTKFVEKEVAPLRDALAPSTDRPTDISRWTPVKIAERVRALAEAFKRIMKADNVRHQDRSVAETAAEQIVTAIGHVSNALEKIEAQNRRPRVSYDGIPHEAGLRLLSGSASSPTDRICASLFVAAIRETSQPNPLRINSGYLLNFIDVVRHLNPEALKSETLARDGVSVRDIEDPVAASMLLWNWKLQNPREHVEDPATLLAQLRNTAADDERRDILAALSHTDILQSHERTLLHRYSLDLQDKAFETMRQLEQAWGACNELMSAAESALKARVNEANELTAASGSAGASIPRNLLLLTWLQKTVTQAMEHRDRAASAVLELASAKSSEFEVEIRSYFDSGDYRAGVTLFHTGAIPKITSDRSAGRRTIWRDEATRTWPEPRAKLSNDLRGATSEQSRLIEAWTSGVLETSQREGLHRAFYSVISGEAGRSTNENQRRFPVRLADLRDHKERKTVVSCETIRQYFQKSKMNPTFLPQLAEFSHIVITYSPNQTSRGTGLLDDWIKASSTEAVGSLVVFLAPGLSIQRRDELSAGLRKRNIAAAIIDDVDLCRLCAASIVADGHDFIPFLEILLEQLDLDRASPFSSLDGQHVRLETYIGRVHEAQKVALGSSYTRIFSGRKLGKSALLKCVTNTYNGHQLPSGNILSVIFITIAGGESERWVVDGIIEEMTTRFSLPESQDLKDQPPAERFSIYMKRFLAEKPGQSVLLILDEADAFVEGQLANYDIARENSLSFRMMKELPAQVDANQMPRIRTIFSGYRVTNTRGGVWANAGDVLVLRPLAEEEAAHFLQGMLARIGISLGNHAPFVAMRCGFQPAVLIRFGENLVKRLKRATRAANRETLTVSHDEVLATLGEQGVLDEIKTVVNNNFQGNRMGSVVFGATLLALKDLEPGLALDNGPVQILKKIEEIDSNLDWLKRIDASPLSEIERNLQDFIDRELLTVSDAPRFGVREYRLRFPHFLPVLTQQSEIALEVRQQIQAIRAGATQRRQAQCVLSESSLDVIRYWYHQANTDLCKLVIVGGHWARALEDKKCGVPDRLGSDSKSIFSISEPELASLMCGSTRVFDRATASDWPTYLQIQASRPLVIIGGVDILRAARNHALKGGDVPVEVVALGRLTESTLAWWFEDARALHFQTGDAIAKIANATDLIPFFVELFDSSLPHTAGSDVSNSDLEQTISRFEIALKDAAQSLCDPSNKDGLLARELDLLTMAVRVGEEVTDEFDLEREFPEYWALICEDGNRGAPLSEPGDWVSLKLLTEIGLLPLRAEAGTQENSRSLGRVKFETSGVLVRLIKMLEKNSAP